MEVVFTKDKIWLNKWNDYVASASRASHLILSDWLNSYSSYGFDYEVGIVLKNRKIVGGFGAVLPEVFFFKFYIIPHGPILDKGYENYLDELLKQGRARATECNCCYFQFSLPISGNDKIREHVYIPSEIKIDQNIYTKGKLFNHIYCTYGLNWVDLSAYKNAEAYLEELTPKVRRNIRLPYNKAADASFVTEEKSIGEGYKVVEANSQLGQYAVRSFNEFKYTILPLVNNEYAYFMNVTSKAQIKASCFVIKSGNYLTNITGGVLREKPDVKLGYMLQWEMIKKTFELGYKGYNISMGGSEGVKDFKERFGAEAIFFENSHFHSVLKPFVFNMFLKFEKYIKPYKSYISRMLAKTRRC